MPAVVRRWSAAFGDNARRRGLIGVSRAWLAVLVASKLVRLARRAAKRDGRQLRHSQALRPGETLEIRHLAPRRR